MASCEKISLDDAEAAQVKLYPLLLLNYSQFAVIGGAILLLVLGGAFVSLIDAAVFERSFTAFVTTLSWTLLGWGSVWALFRFGIPFVRPLLQTHLRTRKARWIAGGVAAAVLIFLSRQFGFRFFGVVEVAVFLLLPFAQSSIVCRIKRGPMLAAAVVSSAGLAVGALIMLLYASDRNLYRSELTLLIIGLFPAFAWGWSLATRFFFISRVSDQTRSLLQAHFRSVFSWEALRMFAGVPPVWNYLQSNKKPTLVLFLLANLFGGLAMLTTLGFTSIGSRILKVPEEALILAPLILLLALVVFVLLMYVCDRAARAKTRISAKELIASDPREPILFLRAFADDQVALPLARLGLIGAVLSLGRHRKSFDELLLEEGTIYGPVVALGNPNDTVPPYGVARGYFQNADWKKAVSDLARASQLIVLTLHDTEAVWWEVAHVVEKEYAHKTLFVLPPSHRDAAPNVSALSRLIKHLPALPEATQRELTEADARRDTIAVAINPDGRASIIRSATFSSFAYLMLLRWFMRSRLQESVAPAAAAQAQTWSFADAQAAFAGVTAGTTSFSTAASPPKAEATRDPIPPSEPAWIKAVRVAGARMGLLGGLLVILIEGLRLLARRLAPKVRDAAKDWTNRASNAAAASQRMFATSSTGSARVSPSLAIGEHARRLADAVRDVSWPAWVTRRTALAAGGVAVLLLLGWAGLRPSSTGTTTTPFTPVSYTPPAPPPRQQTSEAPSATSEYDRLYRDGYVFDPNKLAAPPVSDERCLTSSLNASLANDERNRRRLSYQVVKDCSRAIRNNPGYAIALMARGQAYKTLGQTAAAIIDLRKAQAIDPSLPISTDLAELEDQQQARKKKRKY